MQDIIGTLLLMAVNFSQYDMPEQQPLIEAVNHQQLIDTLCEGKECNALAYYDDKKNTIFYDDKLTKDSIIAQGYIVHEMVHFLQYQHDAVVEEPNCKQRMLLEREAYQVQQRFLRSNHIMTYDVDMAIRLLSGVCNH